MNSGLLVLAALVVIVAAVVYLSARRRKRGATLAPAEDFEPRGPGNVQR